MLINPDISAREHFPFLSYPSLPSLSFPFIPNPLSPPLPLPSPALDAPFVALLDEAPCGMGVQIFTVNVASRAGIVIVHATDGRVGGNQNEPLDVGSPKLAFLMIK